MAEEIKAGDIVAVKSGGPLMTVAFVENGQAYCEWFESKTANGRLFSLNTLEKREKDGGFQQKPNW